MNKDDEILFALNALRVLVLKECEDGKFRQVGLTAEQFKKVSDSILVDSYKDENLKPGFEMAVLNINPDWEMESDSFLGLASYYEHLDE